MNIEQLLSMLQFGGGNAPTGIPAGLFSDQAAADLLNPGMAVPSPLMDGLSVNQDPSQMVTQGGLFPGMPMVGMGQNPDAGMTAEDAMRLAGGFDAERRQSPPSGGLFRPNPYEAPQWTYMQPPRRRF